MVFLLSGSVVVYKTGIPYIINKAKSTLGPAKPNTFYSDRVSLFDELSEKQNQIVLLGDSLTQYGEWSEITGVTVLNRGIFGDTTDGMLKRLAQVTIIKPSKLFILIGTNDLMQGKDVATVAQNYQQIVERVRKETPETKIFIQSVLPVNKDVLRSDITNENVIALNKQLQLIAEKTQSTYVDLYSLLLVNNKLDPQCTHDGLHLSGKGYQVWEKEIEKYIR